MELIDVSVSLTVGVLGVAYPVLLQSVTRLDDKYRSSVIVDLFTKEPELKWFRYLLVASLFTILLWGLQLPVLINSSIIHSIFSDSGKWLAQLASVALAVMFFFLVAKVITYSITIQVVRYLMKKHDSSIKHDDFRHFIGLSDILFTSIREVNQSVVATISEYLYQAFNQVRIAQSGKPVEYPDHYYRLLYDILLELEANPDPRFRYLADRAVGGIWLLGEMTENEVSQSTFRWLWILMRHSIERNHDDYVLGLWEHADQHAAYQLNAIELEHSADYTQIVNQEDIERRKKERHTFEEFFIALGGLVLFQKRNDLIRKMFQHTRSIPPRYELLPSQMDDVFHWYNWFFDHGRRNFSWIESTYSMPGLSSMGNEGETKAVILKYIALLFIRQFSLHAYYVYQNPLAMPAIPATQVEKSNWLASMDLMIDQVTELYNDRDLMKEVGLSLINDDWCVANQKTPPIQMLNDFKLSIQNSIQQGLREQQPAEDKVKLFYETSKQILVPVMNDLIKLKGPDNPSMDVQKWFIIGEHHRQDKSTFVHDQGFDHFNYHSILAERLAEKIRNAISEVFWRCKTSQYLINKEQVKEALNRLSLGDKRYVVVSFGIDAGEFVKNQGGSFSNVRFIFFKNSISRLAGRCFFVLREADLPQISFLPPGDNWITKEELVLLDESVNLFGAVVDLHVNQTIREAIQPDVPNEDLHKSVMTTLAFSIEWKFKKNIRCVYFSIVTPQRPQGVPNELKDILPFDD